MKIKKGKIILSVKDYENIKKEVNEKGKTIYVVYTKPREDTNTIINKAEFEKKIAELNRNEMCRHFNTTMHYLNDFMKKNYNETCYNIIKRNIQNVQNPKEF